MTEMDKSPDWAFFADNPERCYCMRLASAAEIAKYFEGATLARDCFVYCLSRLKRGQSLELHTRLVVLPPQPELDESDCLAAWCAAEDKLVGGHVERTKQ
jgi:hypothetical protein